MYETEIEQFRKEQILDWHQTDKLQPLNPAAFDGVFLARKGQEFRQECRVERELALDTGCHMLCPKNKPKIEN